MAISMKDMNRQRHLSGARIGQLELCMHVEINEIARKLCAGKSWSYTYVSEQEEEYIL